MDVETPPVVVNTAFKSFEDLSLPKFNLLREKYQLDTIFRGDEDEFGKVLLLRNWIKTVMAIDNSGVGYPGNDQAEGILDAALQGHGFHCGHFMIVQNAILNSYGYVARCMAAGEGDANPLEGHHGVNEVWINSLAKWVMVDAKYNIHFEKNGIPLSALQIRDEWLKNKAADIQLMKGPDRIPIEFDEAVSNRTREQYARIYTWLEWETYNNRYSSWPHAESYMNHYVDDYYKKNVWLWGGKPHWAYGTEFLVRVEDRKAIEWTPNTLSSTVETEGSVARIVLKTLTTPNFKSFQMKSLAGSEWRDIADTVEVSLNEGRNIFEFRTLNLANMGGPVHRVVLD